MKHLSSTVARVATCIAIAAAILPVANCRKMSDAAVEPDSIPAIQEFGPSLEDCLARNPGKRVLILFTANWGLQGELIAVIMGKERVRARLQQKDTVGVVANLTHRHEECRELEKRHGQQGLPFMAVYPADRTVKPEVWGPGFSTEEECLEFLNRKL